MCIRDSRLIVANDIGQCPYLHNCLRSARCAYSVEVVWKSFTTLSSRSTLVDRCVGFRFVRKCVTDRSWELALFLPDHLNGTVPANAFRGHVMPPKIKTLNQIIRALRNWSRWPFYGWLSTRKFELKGIRENFSPNQKPRFTQEFGVNL